MPTGTVKWYDAEKGFGFLSQESGPDVYVRAEALPAGTPSLKSGTRVEFGVVQGRKGEQALSVQLLDPAPSVSKARRKSPDQLATIVEDSIKLLDNLGGAYRHGRHPDSRVAGRAAKVLRALAEELEL